MFCHFAEYFAERLYKSSYNQLLNSHDSEASYVWILSEMSVNVKANGNPIKDTCGLTLCLLSELRKSLCVYDTVLN